MKLECIIYHLDQNGRFIYVSKTWNEFALANHSSKITADAIMHRNISDFIVDEDNLHIYEILIARVQREQIVLMFPFRCDAPDRRRYMQMEIFPVSEKITGFKSCTLREEPRPKVALLDPTTERTDEFLTICSWCKKIKVDDNQWLEVEEAVSKLGLFEERHLPQLSHGICPVCFKKMLEDG